MSYKLLLVCDRCGDSVLIDNPNTPQRVFTDDRGAAYALCDNCAEKFVELNNIIKKYSVDRKRQFFEGENT